MDRSKPLQEELNSLKQRLARLEEEVSALRLAQSLQQHPVESLLNQSGFPILSHGDRSQLIFPQDISILSLHHFYQLMRRYSFRLFLRDLIHFPEGKDSKVLSRYCSQKTVRFYLQELSEMGIITVDPDKGYELIRKGIPSFGPTLEWYICEIFQREFMAPALFNLKLRNTRSGGDYDILAVIMGQLAYVEAKSSPPRGVELPDVSAFLNRFAELQPDFAVFLVDTELRMADKMAPLFAESLPRVLNDDKDWDVVRLHQEIFHIGHRIYLANSRRGIYSNLRYCFRDFLRWRGKAPANL